MRRFPGLVATLLVLFVALPAAAQNMPIRIDQAARLVLSGSARDVIIGNPAVADVTVLDGRTLVVTGKGYGITNLIVVDGRGRTILDRQIIVSASDDGRVTMYRGPDLYNYACAPRCERTPMPGEKDTTYQQAISPFTTSVQRASGAASAQGE
ncbi:MAG TPA: pilus assembly protein N-terminal domain-containing protein [Caulobacter sp.]|nr:pilus assembly protein N-terminal domain-containing protein [Caulobacter sp.]